jgi:hypothetical protein
MTIIAKSELRVRTLILNVRRKFSTAGLPAEFPVKG